MRWRAERLRLKPCNVRIWHGCVHCFILKTLLTGGECVRRGEAGKIQVQRRHPHLCILLVLPSGCFDFFYYYGVFIGGWGRGVGSRTGVGENRIFFFSYVFELRLPPPPIRSPATTSTRPVFDHLCHWTACSLDLYSPTPPLLLCDSLLLHPLILDLLILKTKTKKKPPYTSQKKLEVCFSFSFHACWSLFTLDSVRWTDL